MAQRLTNPRKYDQRIKLQTKKTVRDAEGIVSHSWVDVLSLWAFRKPLTNRWREYFEAAGFTVEKMIQLELRYRAGITPDMRIIHGKTLENGQEVDRIYEIKAVLDDVKGDQTETWLMALEMSNG